MKLDEARTEALILANTRGVNHVIVKVAHEYFVYTKTQYPRGYIEEISPTLHIEEPVKEVKRTLKKQVDVQESEVL